MISLHTKHALSYLSLKEEHYTYYSFISLNSSDHGRDHILALEILQVGVDTKPAEEIDEYGDGSNDDHESDAQRADHRSNRNTVSTTSIQRNPSIPRADRKFNNEFSRAPDPKIWL